MPTYQSELAGVSPIVTQLPPTKSKHDLDLEYKKNHEMALYQKELRRLDNYQIMEYKQDLTETLWNPYDKVKNQLNEWNYRTISEYEALHTPYRKRAA